jgi:hypothetical protein
MAASGHLEWCQTIVGRLIRIQFSPGSFRRKFTALDLDLLMAVIAVCLAPAVHPIAADIILTALAVWAMRTAANAPGPSERKPGRAFTYHHAALGQSETYPSAPANP